MNRKHNAHRSSRFLLGLPMLVVSALLASATAAAADEELAAAGPQPDAHDLSHALGPDAARQIRHDATVAETALAAELRAELAVIVKPSLGHGETSANDQEAHSDAATPASANADTDTDDASRGGAVQSRAAIEHTRVFMLVRAQRAQQGVLVQ